MWVACCHLMSRLPNHVHITSQPRFILCGLFGFFLLDQVTKLVSVYRKYCYRKSTTEIFTTKPCPPKNWLLVHVIDILIGLVIQQQDFKPRIIRTNTVRPSLSCGCVLISFVSLFYVSSRLISLMWRRLHVWDSDFGRIINHMKRSFGV